MKPVMCERGKSKRGVAVKTRSTVSGSARRSHSRKARRARREREREKESGAHWDIEHETERENERKNERISGSYKNGLMTRQHIRICMAVDGRQPNERGIDPELKEKKRSGHGAQQKKCKQRKQRRGIEQKKKQALHQEDKRSAKRCKWSAAPVRRRTASAMNIVFADDKNRFHLFPNAFLAVPDLPRVDFYADEQNGHYKINRIFFSKQ